jgi:hypothetical protein
MQSSRLPLFSVADYACSRVLLRVGRRDHGGRSCCIPAKIEQGRVTVRPRRLVVCWSAPRSALQRDPLARHPGVAVVQFDPDEVAAMPPGDYADGAAAGERVEDDAAARVVVVSA